MSLDVRSLTEREPEWLKEERLDAERGLSELDLPRLEKVRLESWRLDAFEGASPVASVESPELDGGIATHHAAVLRRRLPEELARKGVVVAPLAEVLAEDPAWLRRYLFGKGARLPDRLRAIHRARLDGGVVVRVPSGVECGVPLEILAHVSGDAVPHTLVVVERMARADVVETLTAPEGARGTVNAMVELYVEEGAFLRYFGIQTVDERRMRLFRPKHAYVARDARVEWYLVEVGGFRAVAHNTTHLLGPGASADSAALFLAGGRQDFHVATTMLHESPRTESNMETRGVLKGHAHVAYIGTTDIFKESPGCQSWQKESTLMLSHDSRADLIPALWIRNHDVSRAGHAAAAGRVNEEQLYYLMSRGIPRTEAELLIVHGYLKPLLDRIPLRSVVERLGALVEKKVRT